MGAEGRIRVPGGPQWLLPGGPQWLLPGGPQWLLLSGLQWLLPSGPQWLLPSGSQWQLPGGPWSAIAAARARVSEKPAVSLVPQNPRRETLSSDGSAGAMSQYRQVLHLELLASTSVTL